MIVILLCFLAGAGSAVGGVQIGCSTGFGTLWKIQNDIESQIFPLRLSKVALADRDLGRLWGRLGRRTEKLSVPK